MYRPMLFLHWKQIRMALVPFMIASFGLPLLAIEGLGTPPGMDAATLEAYRLVTDFQAWLPFFPMLAAAIGITLALSAWNWDHQMNHVYALSLPVTRWEYTVAKMGAGVTLALLPVLAMWIGSHVAAASLSLPAGLNAYPNQLTVRFFFAILIGYAAFFALAAGTVKTAVWVLGAVVGFVVIGGIGSEMLADQGTIDFFVRVNVVEAVVDWMLEAPGPLEVFTGSWSLIDV